MNDLTLIESDCSQGYKFPPSARRHAKFSVWVWSRERQEWVLAWVGYDGAERMVRYDYYKEWARRNGERWEAVCLVTKTGRWEYCERV
jgi:hypothetical protein